MKYILFYKLFLTKYTKVYENIKQIIYLYSIMTDNLQEKNQQVLNNISQLQTQEKRLHDSLDDVSLTTDQRKQIIDKINEISQMRINMYAGLKDMYSFYRKNALTAGSTLEQQMLAVDILENELTQSKERLDLLEAEKNNALRLVQINTYYGKRYSAHSQLMKTIVIMCIPLIILAVLANKGILPVNLYVVLSGLVLVVGLVIIGLQIIDISNRSNMNWDEYNWYFDQESAETTDEYTTSSSSSDPWGSVSMTCIGSACCYEGSTYDKSINVCVPNDKYEEENEEIKESFRGLEKYAYTQVKPTYYNNVVSASNAF